VASLTGSGIAVALAALLALLLTRSIVAPLGAMTGLMGRMAKGAGVPLVAGGTRGRLRLEGVQPVLPVLVIGEDHGQLRLRFDQLDPAALDALQRELARRNAAVPEQPGRRAA
jgi:hypothetical protein